MLRRFVPPGAECRVHPQFPEEPGADLRARLSDPQFLWETVMSEDIEAEAESGPEKLDALAGVVRGQMPLPKLWERFGRTARKPLEDLKVTQSR
jgi:hypothetical protein